MEIPVLGIETVHLKLKTSAGKLINASINDALNFPDLKAGNLQSECKFERNGLSISLKNGKRHIMQNGEEIIFACLDLYDQFMVQEYKNKSSFVSFAEAHKRFCHPDQIAKASLKQLYPDLIPNKPEGFYCSSCLLSKSTHKSGNPCQKQATKPFEIVHSDLSGKFSLESLNRKRYYKTFIDDYSRYAWIYFLRDKSDTYHAVREFVVGIKNQYETTIKKLFSDNGGEHVDKKVKQFLLDNDNDHENSPPYEHKSNGIAERFNRTIVTKARTLLIDFPKYL